MARLEDLTRGANVRGILPAGPVSVIDVQWHGSDALTLTYRDSGGRTNQELVYRDREPTLEVVQADLRCAGQGVARTLYRMEATRKVIEDESSVLRRLLSGLDPGSDVLPHSSGLRFHSG